jgi:hypothetical protein
MDSGLRRNDESSVRLAGRGRPFIGAFTVRRNDGSSVGSRSRCLVSRFEPALTPGTQNFSTHGRSSISEVHALRGCLSTCR